MTRTDGFGGHSRFLRDNFEATNCNLAADVLVLLKYLFGMMIGILKPICN